MNITRKWPVAHAALALGLGLAGGALAGCAGDLPATTAPQPAPANYARLTAEYFAATLPKRPLAGATISAIQPAVAPQPAEWVACVKLASGEYYAAFYGEGKVVDTRSALTIDRCGAAEGYAAFPAPESQSPRSSLRRAKRPPRADTPSPQLPGITRQNILNSAS
jgi:hypothetical protein